ncbi:MAG: hypothetical protein AAB515_01990 [Patescibacteria group bacterium]
MHGPENAGDRILSWQVTSGVDIATPYTLQVGAQIDTFFVAANAGVTSESIVIFLPAHADITFAMLGPQSTPGVDGVRGSTQYVAGCEVLFDCYEGGVQIESASR